MRLAAPLWFCPLALWPALAAPPDRIVVVCHSGVAAYAETLEGIQAELGKAAEVVDLGRGGEAGLAAAAARGKLVLAVGAEALRAAAGLRPAPPLVATMVLREEAAGVASVAQVLLDAPLAAVLDALREHFPRRSRLGIIRNPRHASEDRASLAARVRRHGFTPVLAEAAGPGELLQAFRSLKGKVDLVLCFPDSALYNSATVKPLILASLESRVPIVGFSANFVRAGAAVGVYPDFRDLGRQAAEAALRWTPGRAEAGEERPRRLVVAVNQRVLRLVGMEHPESARVVVFK